MSQQHLLHRLGSTTCHPRAQGLFSRSHQDGGASLPGPKATFLMCILLLLLLLSLQGRTLCQLSRLSSCFPRRVSLSSRVPGRPFR